MPRKYTKKRNLSRQRRYTKKYKIISMLDYNGNRL